eukprot:6170700-Amphidinium_carterae.1
MALDVASDPSLIGHGTLLLCGALDDEGNPQGTLLLAFEWSYGAVRVSSRMLRALAKKIQFHADPSPGTSLPEVVPPKTFVDESPDIAELQR